MYGDSAERLEWLRRYGDEGDSAELLLPGDYLPRADARGDAAHAPPMALVGRLLMSPSRARVAGDLRANENVALTATHTLFAREHNRIVDALPESLSDEERFQIARRVVGAEQQYITYEEFLPALGVELSDYDGYDADVNASITNEFAVVGFRAHSMVHGELEPSAPDGTYSDEELAAFAAQGIGVEHEDGLVVLVVPLNLAFANPDLLERIGLGPVLKGIGGEPQYKNDEQIDNQLRSVLFQIPKPGAPNPAGCLEGPTLPDCFAGVVDLGALDIERGRDHGMPTYTALARAYGLKPKTNFVGITGESSASFAARSRGRREPPDRRRGHPRLHVVARPLGRGRPARQPGRAGRRRLRRAPHAARGAAAGDLRERRRARRLRRDVGREARPRHRVRRAPAQDVEGAVRGPARRRPVLLPLRRPPQGHRQALRHRLQAHARRDHRAQHGRGRRARTCSRSRRRRARTGGARRAQAAAPAAAAARASTAASNPATTVRGGTALS